MHNVLAKAIPVQKRIAFREDLSEKSKREQYLFGIMVSCEKCGRKVKIGSAAKDRHPVQNAVIAITVFLPVIINLPVIGHLVMIILTIPTATCRASVTSNATNSTMPNQLHIFVLGHCRICLVMSWNVSFAVIHNVHIPTREPAAYIFPSSHLKLLLVTVEEIGDFCK